MFILNTNDAIIAETERTLGVKFDESITAEQAGAYKPALEGFQLARNRLGLKVSQIWHAGFGFKDDIVPPKRLGCTAVWVSRPQLHFTETHQLQDTTRNNDHKPYDRTDEYLLA